MNIYYKKSVSNDFKSIHPEIRRKIKGLIEKKLTENPYYGEKLYGKYEKLYKIRFGDYRVIYTIIPQGILILRIGHRKEVYRK